MLQPPPQPPPPQPSGILGMLSQLISTLGGRKPPPSPPVRVTKMPVVNAPLSAPPYPTPLKADPLRYQQETWAVALTSAAPSAIVRTETRPAFYAVYLKSPGSAGDGVWCQVGSGTPPVPPTLVTGLPQQTPEWLSGTNTLYLHGSEQTIAFTFVGTGPVVVIIMPCTNVKIPRI